MKAAPSFARPYDPQLVRLQLQAGGADAQQALKALLYAHLDWVTRAQKRWKVSQAQARQAFFEALCDLGQEFLGQATLLSPSDRLFELYRKRCNSLRTEQLQATKPQVFHRLRKKCQEILLLTWQGYSDSDIAQRLGYRRAATVQNRRQQAQQQLQLLLLQA